MTLWSTRKPPWLICLLALGPFAAFAPAPAHAVGSASCTLSVTSLAFGQYVPSRSSPSDFTATINLVCFASGTTPVPILGTIALIGSPGSFARELTDGGHRLRYQLFLDPARTIPWGDGSGDTRTKSISGVVGLTSPLRETLTVYGRILARQADAAVGNYTDQITAILNY